MLAICGRIYRNNPMTARCDDFEDRHYIQVCFCNELAI